MFTKTSELLKTPGKLYGRTERLQYQTITTNDRILLKTSLVNPCKISKKDKGERKN